MMADAVTQTRAGVFPVLVGQSAYAFNGAVYPIRVAPAYQYLGCLVDVLTWHSLGFFALQHATVVLSFVAAGLTAYWSLLQLAPGRRWSAFALSLLYLSCPGIVGLIYLQDLYMSMMAVPWIPITLAGAVRTFSHDDRRSHAMMSGGLAALWWSHAPIALWCSVAVFLLQAWRLIQLRAAGASALRHLALSGGLFLLLAAYPFVSVFTLRYSGESVIASVIDRAVLIRQISDAFPGMLLPLHASLPVLSHLQLGYGLAMIALAAGATAIWHHEIRALAPGLAIAAFLGLLLVPVPGLTRWLWLHFPETVVQLTHYWPMQRLYVVLAGLLIALAQLCPWLTARRVAAVVLAGACGWSFFQASTFVRTAYSSAPRTTEMSRWDRPENVALERFSYNQLPRQPDYMSHGVMDPNLESRLLDPVSETVIISSSASLPSSPNVFTASRDANPGMLDLQPSFTLKPGAHHRLTLDFASPPPAGVLQVTGPNTFREYEMPSSGNKLAFGAAPGNTPALGLWTSGPDDEVVQLRFIPDSPLPAGAEQPRLPFTGFRFETPDPKEMPVQLVSLIPYVAIVRTTRPALLETFRMAVPGYVAQIDGRPVLSRKSAQGMVAIPVPAGESRVELSYRGPVLLRLAFWASTCSWLLLGLAAWKLRSASNDGQALAS